MAAPSRRSGASLIEAPARASPERFDFVQAVRILERAAERAGGAKPGANTVQVGLDNDPAREAVLLRAALENGVSVQRGSRAERTMTASGRRWRSTSHGASMDPAASSLATIPNSSWRRGAIGTPPFRIFSTCSITALCRSSRARRRNTGSPWPIADRAPRRQRQ